MQVVTGYIKAVNNVDMTRQGWMTYKCMQLSCGQPARGNHAESTTGKQRTPTRIHYVWSENERFTWKHNKNVQIHTFEKVPSSHIGPDPGLSPAPPTTVHRRAGVVKWKLYIACRCEIECVCHLCVSSVMEWQHVRGLPASSHTVHAEIIMTSL